MSHPTVTWAQRPDSIWLSVDVTSPKDLVVDLSSTGLKLKCTSDGKEVNIDITFFKSIIVAESKYSQHRLITFYLKKEEDESWPRLTDTTTKRAWLKVDWSKWVDSDDEGEKPDFDYSDMASMGGMGGMGGFGDMAGMGGMGGMGGFGDMAGMSKMRDFYSKEGDSDDEDEDLPDLDGPVDSDVAGGSSSSKTATVAAPDDATQAA